MQQAVSPIHCDLWFETYLIKDVQGFEARCQGLGILKTSQKQLANCITAAINDGHMYGCIVMKKPFTTRGIFRPVKLPCSCVISEAAAQCSLQTKYCQLCYKPLSKWTSIVEDVTSVRVVEAGQLGLAVRMLQHNSVHLGAILETGFARPLHAATMRLSDFKAGEKEIDVTVEVLKTNFLPHERAHVTGALTTSFLASESPHILTFHGGLWKGENLWCESLSLLL